MRHKLNAVLDLLETETNSLAVDHLKALAAHYLDGTMGQSNGWKMTDEELSAAVSRGKIAAIKMVRERLGLSLAGSKKLVESEVPERGLTFKQWD